MVADANQPATPIALKALVDILQWQFGFSKSTTTIVEVLKAKNTNVIRRASPKRAMY
jgi:hypothetical protein